MQKSRLREEQVRCALLQAVLILWLGIAAAWPYQTNAAPVVAEPIAEPWITDEGERITFIGLAHHPDGLALTYEWDFGDGSPVRQVRNEQVISHVYADDGEFGVTLTVRDTAGRSASNRTTVVIRNVAPIIEDLGWSGSGAVGEALAFSAAVVDPGVNDELHYRWDFGDGSDEQQGVDLATVRHRYTEPGTYTVRLVVDDGDGGRDERTLLVRVGGGYAWRVSGAVNASSEGEAWGFQASPMTSDGRLAPDRLTRGEHLCFVQVQLAPAGATSLLGQFAQPALALTAALPGGLREGVYPIGDRARLGERVMPHQAEFGNPGAFFATFPNRPPRRGFVRDPDFGSVGGQLRVTRFSDGLLQLEFEIELAQTARPIRAVPGAPRGQVEEPRRRAFASGVLSHPVPTGLADVRDTVAGGGLPQTYYLCREPALFQVTAVSPAPRSRNVDYRQANIEIEFSQPVDFGEVDESVYIEYMPPDPEDADDMVVVEGSFQRLSDRRFRFVPHAPLKDGIRYRVFVHGGENGIVSRDDAVLAADFRSDFWTRVEVAEVEVAVYQVSLNPVALAPGKPTLTRVFARWEEKSDVHPDWQVTWFPATVTVTADGEPVYPPRTGVWVQRPDQFTDEHRRMATNSINFFNWRPPPGQRSLALRARIEPEVDGGDAPETFESPALNVQVWPMKESLHIDSYLLRIGAWGPGTPPPPWASRHARDVLAEADRYIVENFPLLGTRARHNGPLTVSPKAVLRWPGEQRASVMAWFTHTASARSDADIIVAFVPGGLGFPDARAWAEEHMEKFLSTPGPLPGVVQLTLTTESQAAGTGRAEDGEQPLPTTVLAVAFAHELGHTQRLEHVPWVSERSDYERVCGPPGRPRIESAPEAIEGFRMDRSGWSGAHKSLTDGNAESGDNVIASLMHPCAPIFATEQLFMTNRHYELLLHILALDYHQPPEPPGRSQGWLRPLFLSQAHAAAPEPAGPTDGHGNIHLFGVFHGEGAEILEMDRVAESRRQPAETGALELVVRDVDGARLSYARFDTLSAADDGHAFFSAIVADHPDAAVIQVRQGDRVLVEQARSANPPRLEVLAPERAAELEAMVRVAWRADDADGDAITVKAWYSPTGAYPWALLGAGGAEDALTVDRDDLEPGPAPKFLLTASDGFNVTEVLQPVTLARPLALVRPNPDSNDGMLESLSHGREIHLAFNGPVENADGMITLRDGDGAAVPIMTRPEPGSHLLLVVPREPLAPGAEYHLELGGELRDRYGNSLGRDTTLHLRTAP